jgi:hypothetical protein
MSFCMPFEDLDKSAGLVSCRYDRQGGYRLHCHNASLRGACLPKSLNQILNSFGFADRLSGKSHTECPFDPQDQFGPTQAIDSEIAFYSAGRRDVDEPDTLWMQFPNKIGNHRDQLAPADFTLRVPWRPVRSIKDFLH